MMALLVKPPARNRKVSELLGLSLSHLRKMTLICFSFGQAARRIAL